MSQALAYVGLAILALIFVYMLGRMFSAGCLRSWREFINNRNRKEADDAEKKPQED